MLPIDELRESCERQEQEYLRLLNSCRGAGAEYQKTIATLTASLAEADRGLAAFRAFVRAFDAWMEPGNPGRHGDGPWWMQCTNDDAMDMCEARAAVAPWMATPGEE